MAHIFGYLSLGLLAAVVVLKVASWRVADRFFERLILSDPSLAKDLPKPSLIIIGERGGPIRSSYMSYLKEHRYRSLADPELRALGHRSWVLVASYAVCFAALLIAALLWNYFRANGP